MRSCSLRSTTHKSPNYNPFISSFRLVIMTLVDVANGRSRHVPYRDSRLTFLLQVKIQRKSHESFPPYCVHCFLWLIIISCQDSLGGNSKTTIVSNVSPSIRYPASVSSYPLTAIQRFFLDTSQCA